MLLAVDRFRQPERQLRKRVSRTDRRARRNQSSSSRGDLAHPEEFAKSHRRNGVQSADGWGYASSDLAQGPRRMVDLWYGGRGFELPAEIGEHQMLFRFFLSISLSVVL